MYCIKWLNVLSFLRSTHITCTFGNNYFVVYLLYIYFLMNTSHLVYIRNTSFFYWSVWKLPTWCILICHEICTNLNPGVMNILIWDRVSAFASYVHKQSGIVCEMEKINEFAYSFYFIISAQLFQKNMLIHIVKYLIN